MPVKQIIKKTTFAIILLIVSIIIGGGFAIYRIKSWKNNSQINIGSWKTIGNNKDVNTDDLLSIAQIAVYATYPLTKKEVIYLNANTDSDGNAIDPKYDYVIKGKKFDACYWSITAYDQDGFLIKNQIDKYSYNFENVKYEPDSTSFRINLSATEKKENWLPVTNTQKIMLVIRLYQPSDSLRNGLNQAILPIIKRNN